MGQGTVSHNQRKYAGSVPDDIIEKVHVSYT